MIDATQSSDNDYTVIEPFHARNPIQRSYDSYGADACSATRTRADADNNWWQARFEGGLYQVQSVDILPMSHQLTNQYYSPGSAHVDYLSGATVLIGGKLCYRFPDNDNEVGSEWIKFECYGDGASGDSIRVESRDSDYQMAICGIKVYGNMDPRTVLDQEYEDFLDKESVEIAAKAAKSNEKQSLTESITQLEKDYKEIEKEAEELSRKDRALWGLVDTEYLWKDRCYFTFLSISLFCYNADEQQDQFNRYNHGILT